MSVSDVTLRTRPTTLVLSGMMQCGTQLLLDLVHFVGLVGVLVLEQEGFDLLRVVLHIRVLFPPLLGVLAHKLWRRKYF